MAQIINLCTIFIKQSYIGAVFYNEENIINFDNVYTHSVLDPVIIDDNNISNIFVVDNPEYIKQVFIDKGLYVE